jgi:hypothetical protein
MSLTRNAPVLIEERARIVDDLLLAPIPGSPPTAHLLKFTIPVSLPMTPGSEAVGPEDQVTAYIRISLTAPGATGPQAAPIILRDFPERAPESSSSRSLPLHPEHPPRVSGMVEPL